MDSRANPFNRALPIGEPQIGLWLAMASAYTAETLRRPSGDG
jgi:2-keto-3-deoxy-L-rhamnonate aldolase RhmA